MAEMETASLPHVVGTPPERRFWRLVPPTRET
jgi:hypothetical protein